METTIYNIFIKWYTMPKESREPRTLKEFCDQFEITKEDISEFMQRDTYYDDLMKEGKNWGKSKLPEMLHILYEDFKENKKPITAQAFKQLLEVDKEQKTNNINVFNISDQQYRQIVQREARLSEESSTKPPIELLPNNQS